MIEYQRIILADTVRNEAFARALQSAIHTGESVVADIGSGTGFLSFLASKLGAKECHLYEQSALLDLSRALAHENGITNLRFHRQHSTQVRKPVQADIVASETLGNFVLEEGIIETMNDAHRFLKPGGVLLPQSLRQFVAPIVSDRLWKEVTSWDRVGHDLTFRNAREISCQNIYVRTLRESDLLAGGAQEWDSVNFLKKNDPIRTAKLEWSVQQPMTIFGFGLWWVVHLCSGITLSTAPDAAKTHWEQIYMPVLEPLALEAGDRLQLKLSVDSHHAVRIHIAWDVRVLAANGAPRSHQQLDMHAGQVD
ncbi:hypothetical protein AUJ46_01495 [Candidatus Peregrinibacteria bacterium CG1_02_54_53]|nr:MAG: hypothetical protein AUJ46_01495 [Candidatus Peregrinibacteria bacterium CG1_02_54_53]